jgi:hypothetical protein
MKAFCTMAAIGLSLMGGQPTLNHIAAPGPGRGTGDAARSSAEFGVTVSA